MTVIPEKEIRRDQARAQNYVYKADSLKKEDKLDDSVYYRNEAIQWLRRIGSKDEAILQTEKIVADLMNMAKSFEAKGEKGKASIYYKRALDYLEQTKTQDSDLVNSLKSKTRNLATDALVRGVQEKSERLGLMHAISDVTEETNSEKSNVKRVYSQEKTLAYGIRDESLTGKLLGRGTFTKTGVNDITTDADEAKLLAMVEEHKEKARKELDHIVHKDYATAAGHYLTASRILLNRGIQEQADSLLSLAIGTLEDGIAVASKKGQFYENVKLLRQLISAYKIKGDLASASTKTELLMQAYEAECNKSLRKKRFQMARNQAEIAIKVLQEEDPNLDTGPILSLMNLAIRELGAVRR